MKKKPNQSGQSLITLIIFTMVFLSITTMSAIMIMINSRATSDLQLGISTYQVAESGVEEALLRLIRNPNYTGEVLTVGNGSATITITGNELSKTIISEGKLSNFQRKIKVTVSYNDKITINSWREEP